MSQADSSWPCLRTTKRGLQLLVQVQPNAPATLAMGLHGDALRLRLAAPPLEGRANAALIDWIASSIGVPRRAVTLCGGETSRRKLLLIDSERPRVEAWLESIVKDPAPPGR